MSKYRPLQYLLGEYTVHHVKLNLLQPISLSSGYRTSILTMAGVNMEGPYEVASPRFFSSLTYSLRLIGGDFYGGDPVTDLKCSRNFWV